jgi:hypothetical protein
MGVQDGKLLITDTGAAIQPIPPAAGDAAGTCTPASATSVSCPIALEVDVRLGDAADTATIGSLGAATLWSVVLDGGPGDDVLNGGPAGETLIAGSGADRVNGGDGDDRLIASETVAGDDQLDGGPGRNVLDYVGQRDAVHVDVASGRATGPTIGTDTLSGFAEVHGGRGDDELVGGDGPDRLAGGPGDDVIRGAGGDDVLWGELPDAESPGTRDRIDGGPGDDTLDLSRQIIDPGDIESTPYATPDDRRDSVRCGTGRDDVVFASPQDVLPMDCDRVSDESGTGAFDAWVALPPTVTGARTLAFRSNAYHGKGVKLRRGRTLLGQVIPDSRHHHLRFALTPAGRRLAADARPVTVQITGLMNGYNLGNGTLTLALPRL